MTERTHDESGFVAVYRIVSNATRNYERGHIGVLEDQWCWITFYIYIHILCFMHDGETGRTTDFRPARIEISPRVVKNV